MFGDTDSESEPAREQVTYEELYYQMDRSLLKLNQEHLRKEEIYFNESNKDKKDTLSVQIEKIPRHNAEILNTDNEKFHCKWERDEIRVEKDTDNDINDKRKISMHGPEILSEREELKTISQLEHAIPRLETLTDINNESVERQLKNYNSYS